MKIRAMVGAMVLGAAMLLGGSTKSEAAWYGPRGYVAVRPYYRPYWRPYYYRPYVRPYWAPAPVYPRPYAPGVGLYFRF